MYSMVLMMALNGGAAPAIGGHGCNGGCAGAVVAHGCHGGCHGGGHRLFGHGCHGGGHRLFGGHGCNGCHGGGHRLFGGHGCNGCNGGGHACHGGGHRLFGHGCNGCHGGGFLFGHKGHGCHGGYACHGGGHGCAGAGCTGGGSYAPQQPEEIKVKPKMPEGGDAKPTAFADDQALLIVSVPVDAKLTIDDSATTASTEVRTFVTPNGLEKGKDYYYTLKAEATRDGQPVSITRVVSVKAGEETRVTIELPVATTAAR